MRRTAILLPFVLAALLAVPPRVRAEGMESPHQMMKANGELDMEKCRACHEEDMSLSRSKLETCTLCHALPVHTGAPQHISVPPERVKELLSANKNENPELPLRDDGGIYCGTCHIFHDSSMEKWLGTAWMPATTGVAEAVRNFDQQKLKALAEETKASQPVAQFMSKGTRQLRLPINDGSLCLHCHGDKR